jgi:uncharacterized protein (TIGR02246 family)
MNLAIASTSRVVVAALLMTAGLPWDYSRADESDTGTLTTISQIWASDWEAKRLDYVMGLYAPDAVFVTGDGPRVTGLPAIRKLFENALKNYSAEPSLHSVSSAISGDLGYDSGDYKEIITPAIRPTAKLEVHGSYLVIFRRIEGRWRIAEHFWTASHLVPASR